MAHHFAFIRTVYAEFLFQRSDFFLRLSVGISVFSLFSIMLPALNLNFYLICLML